MEILEEKVVRDMSRHGYCIYISSLPCCVFMEICSKQL